jgi:prolyl-tRNA synthetase
MVIRPYGYAVWETLQGIFNDMMAEKGIRNAYFPLLFRIRSLRRKRSMWKGFPLSLRLLRLAAGKSLQTPGRPPDIGNDHVQHVRQMDQKLARSAHAHQPVEQRSPLGKTDIPFPPHHGILWQEGHTVHESESEAMDMVMTALGWYKSIHEDYFAVPVLSGRKAIPKNSQGPRRRIVSKR